MKLIQINGHRIQTKNRIMFAQVDEEDYERLSKYKWRYVGRYIIGTIPYIKDGKKHYKQTLLHRFLMNCPDGMTVDHINRNRMDNRKENLRVCTSAENSRNISVTPRNKSGYKGVHWRKREKKWQASIRVNKKLIYLGDYKDKIDAARAYNEAAKKYFKEYAYLNEIK